MNWTNVKNEQPETEGHYLVWTGEWDGVMKAYWGGKTGWMDDIFRDNEPYNSLDEHVTHWMELPKPPNPSRGKE